MPSSSLPCPLKSQFKEKTVTYISILYGWHHLETVMSFPIRYYTKVRNVLGFACTWESMPFVWWDIVPSFICFPSILLYGANPHLAQQSAHGKYLVSGNKESPLSSLLPMRSHSSAEVSTLPLNDRSLLPSSFTEEANYEWVCCTVELEITQSINCFWKAEAIMIAYICVISVL